MQRAVWRMRAPSLNKRARKVSIWARAPWLRQMLAKQVDQIVGEAVQQQAEGVGQKAMAAQAVGAKAVFEFSR